ncbi:MAG TPA: hypothetical protein PLR99_00805 [Polyangiaceae bacterium]|nr:hypothetical protein [Polyangiaceae bacterium]
MGARDDIARLMKEAAASMKHDATGAVAKLASAYALARASGDTDDTATVAEALARGWARRGSAARSLYFASKAAELSPDWKTAWTTLAKTSELVASRSRGEGQRRRAAILYRTAASAFKEAAAMTKDPEDKRWLLELAGDAAQSAKAPRAS